MSPSHHHHPKLKPPPRPLFSCGIFRNCTQAALSPTAPPATTFLPPSSPAPPPPLTPPPLPPPSTSSNRAAEHAPQTSSSSSSSSTSQSFTQWRFPLSHPPNPPDFHPPPHDAAVANDQDEVFRTAARHFASGERLPALRLLERSLSQGGDGGAWPREVMDGVVTALREPASARAAAKVLLALLLPEPNRRAAVEAGAAEAGVEAVAASGPAGPVAERGLAALELLCTVAEGAAEVRRHAMAAPALAGAVEGMAGRGRECAIGVMAAIYGGEWAAAAPPEVARAVVVALQGECSARGRRKGAQLLRALQETGRVQLGGDGCWDWRSDGP